MYILQVKLVFYQFVSVNYATASNSVSIRFVRMVQLINGRYSVSLLPIAQLAIILSVLTVFSIASFTASSFLQIPYYFESRIRFSG